MKYFIPGASIMGLLAGTFVSISPVLADDGAKPDDNLNAVLWDQTSVEARANAMGAFALAKIRLDQALADPSWTAAPVEQSGDFKSFPPAVVLDVDDTLLNTSNYQAWSARRDTTHALGI